MPLRTEDNPSMSLISLRKDSLDSRRPVLAIGNFDGAHRGHRSVAAAARALAANLSQAGPVIALTFEPHPREFFQPDQRVFRLTPAEDRARRLALIGFDALALLTFDAGLAAMSAEAFITQLMVDKLHAAAVVVGEDFHFGKGRAGTPAFLAEAGSRHGLLVQFVAPFRDEEGEIVSSSAIRAALSAGDLAKANRMLGYSYSVSGTVIHGAKRGRELGYPTANIALSPGNGLRHGIYAVRMEIDGEPRAGVASFGRRPMFDNGAPLLEVFVIDYAGDLYGKRVTVSFEAFLRGEARFDSLEALIRQMDADQAAARRILAAQ
jgi:riboflavin kinase / FMN adenylyltransferase